MLESTVFWYKEKRYCYEGVLLRVRLLRPRCQDTRRKPWRRLQQRATCAVYSFDTDKLATHSLLLQIESLLIVYSLYYTLTSDWPWLLTLVSDCWLISHWFSTDSHTWASVYTSIHSRLDSRYFYFEYTPDNTLSPYTYGLQLYTLLYDNRLAAPMLALPHHHASQGGTTSLSRLPTKYLEPSPPSWQYKHPPA